MSRQLSRALARWHEPGTLACHHADATDLIRSDDKTRAEFHATLEFGFPDGSTK